MSRRLLLSLILLALIALAVTAQEPPHKVSKYIYIGLLGDSGTGKDEQRAVAEQLQLAEQQDALDYVFLLGDNIYNNGEAKYIGSKYLDVYRGLLDRVPFHAALGNHDVRRCDIVNISPLPRDATVYEDCDVDQQLDPRNRFGYPGGQRYYNIAIYTPLMSANAEDFDQAGSSQTLSRLPLLEIFVLDSNTLDTSQTLISNGDDRAQLAWLETALAESRAVWKIVTMHHPMHSPRVSGWFSGRGREDKLEIQLQPIFVKHGVDAVFSGHNHFYARVVPQAGIRYFVAGGGGRGVYRYRAEPGYVYEDEARGKFHHFVHVRVSEERFEFCTVDIEGNIRDSGWFGKGDVTDHAFDKGVCPY